jgi:hypothetical protein
MHVLITFNRVYVSRLAAQMGSSPLFVELTSSLQFSQEPNTTLVQLSSPHHHTLLTSCTHLILLSFSAIIMFGEVQVKFTLEQATKAQRGSRCIALLFL